MKTIASLARRQPLRLTLGTLVLAVAASLATPGHAAPADGMPGAGPGRMMGHGMMGPMGGPGMARMLDAVGATADQKAQIRQIMQAAGAELKAQRDAGRDLRDSLAAEFQQPTVDANRVEALRQQQMARHDQASRRMMQAMIEASRVLTPEQRQQLAKLMKERREKMHSHGQGRRPG